MVHARLVWIVGLMVSVLLSAGPASAQFTIIPMRMELTPRPGQDFQQRLDLQNNDPNAAKVVGLIIADVTQAEEGIWRIVEPNSGFDTSKLRSCSTWMRLSRSNVTVAPGGTAAAAVNFRVPAGVRGCYTAAIVAMLALSPDETGFVTILRYLIPVLIQIQGRPLRQQIELSDLGMEHRPQVAEGAATTLLSINIANRGATYSRLKALGRLRSFQDGHWREITTTEFGEVDIIPGAELRLKSDIERALPPGKYQLTGALYVDGRRVKPLEKELDFVGDPSITKLAADAPLVLNPTVVSIDSMPGATRTTVLRVLNSSEDAVSVTTDLVLPPVLEGVAIEGMLKGSDLNCAQWVEVTPEQFTLRGHGRQSIRIVARMPNPTSTHANYYALLGLHARYADGQGAGVTTAHICVTNKTVEATPKAQPERLTFAAMEASKYHIVARFSNMGNTHFKPRCRAAVISGAGLPMVKILLSGDPGLMLPLEVRDFSGVLNCSYLSDDMYRLAATLEYAPGQEITTQIPIQVSVEEEQRVVQVIRPEEFEQKIGVKW